LVVVTSELTSLFLPTPQDTRSAKNDLCESGLWLEWMLIHWKKLKLRLNVSGRRGGIELQIASEDLHTAELLLAENLTEEDASNYG
jgi:hypothetical protein